MSSIILDSHRDEMFRNFILQDCFKWDISRPSDVERIKQWKEIFNSAYKDVSSKTTEESASYIKCREFICKNW